jgi:hypothetical protein
MQQETQNAEKKKQAALKAQKRAAALRDNLLKRKQQNRARVTTEKDE